MTYSIQNTNYKNLTLEDAIKLGLKPENLNNKIIPEGIAGCSFKHVTASQILIDDLCAYLKNKLLLIYDSISEDYVEYINRIIPLINNYTLNSLKSLFLIMYLTLHDLNNIDNIKDKIDDLTRKNYNREHLIPLDKLCSLDLDNYDK